MQAHRSYRAWGTRSLLGCALLAGWSARALADDQASASDIALARTLGGEGVQLAEQGNCAAAVDKLQRAESLYHAPTILVRLGECQVALGKIVVGTESLQRVVREALPPRAPKPFFDAQVRAQKSLEAALPKLAKLKIHVAAPATVKPLVKVDGEVVPTAALDLDRPADPGSHRIEATAPGYKIAVASATLREGRAEAVSLSLEPDTAAGTAVVLAPDGSAPAAPAVGATPSAEATTAIASAPATASSAPSGAESRGASKVPAVVLLAAGGVGVAVGTVFGLSALSQKNALNDKCSDGKGYCPPDAQSDIDSLKSATTASTIGFVAGAVAGGAGLVWLLLAKSSGESSAEAYHAEARIHPFVAPTSAGIWGSF